MTPPRTTLSLRGKIPVYLSAIRGNKFIGGILAVLGKLGRKINGYGGPALPRLSTSFKAERLQRATEKVKLWTRPHYMSIANGPLGKAMLRMAPTNSRKSISRQENPPPLSETQLAALRASLKELQSKWAAEKEAKASSASSTENGSKAKSAQQSEDASKTSTLFDGVAKYVAPIPTYISDTAKYVAPIPTYITDTAKGLMANKDSKRAPAATESSDAAAESSNNKGLNQKGGGTIPRWKVQGTTTNARTSIQLVTGGLVRAVKVAEPDLCLQELEDLSSHLHKHPWAKGLAVREGLVGALLFIRWRTQNMAVQMQATEALDLVGYQQPVPNVSDEMIRCCIQFFSFIAKRGRTKLFESISAWNPNPLSRWGRYERSRGPRGTPAARGSNGQTYSPNFRFHLRCEHGGHHSFLPGLPQKDHRRDRGNLQETWTGDIHQKLD